MELYPKLFLILKINLKDNTVAVFEKKKNTRYSKVKRFLKTKLYGTLYYPI